MCVCVCVCVCVCLWIKFMLQRNLFLKVFEMKPKTTWSIKERMLRRRKGQLRRWSQLPSQWWWLVMRWKSPYAFTSWTTQQGTHTVNYACAYQTFYIFTLNSIGDEERWNVASIFCAYFVKNAFWYFNYLKLT